VCHLGISTVRSEFSKVTGTIQMDDKNIAKATVDVTIDTATMNRCVTSRAYRTYRNFSK